MIIRLGARPHPSADRIGLEHHQHLRDVHSTRTRGGKPDHFMVSVLGPNRRALLGSIRKEIVSGEYPADRLEVSGALACKRTFIEPLRALQGDALKSVGQVLLYKWLSFANRSAIGMEVDRTRRRVLAQLIGF